MDTPDPDRVELRRLADALRARAERSPDGVALEDGTSVLTFAQWDSAADAAGGGFAAAGVRPGDRLLLPVSNGHALAMATAYMGAHRAGAICVPINTRWLPTEVAWFAGHVGATWAVTDMPDLLSECTLTSWTIDDLPSDLSSLPDQANLPGKDDDADCDVLPTSGTTARPKGVVATEAELVASMDGLVRTSGARRMLHALPLTGYGGLHGMMLMPLREGTTVITAPSFDAHAFLHMAMALEADSMNVVPAMLRLLVECPALTECDLSKLRWVFVGTAALPATTADAFRAALPQVKLINTFGATELGSGNRLILAPELLHKKPGSIGRPGPGGAVEIRDPDGRVLQQGEIGWIWLKSKGAPRRYWNDPTETATTWKDGWVASGDLGYVDDDGDVFLTGRAKEMIIRGGYNIAPNEVEAVILRCPSVSDASVLGVPHDVLGQDVAAAVVPRDPATFERDELDAFLRENLASYKVPRTIVLVDDLPRNAMGKVVKGDVLELISGADPMGHIQ